jgi:hypothetical protein
MGKIAYSADQKLWIYDMISEQRMEIPLKPGSGYLDANFPNWRPDGRWLCFYWGASLNRQIFVVRPDGTGQLMITDGSGDYAERAVFSPDGTRVACNTVYGNVRIIQLVESNGQLLPASRQTLPVALETVTWSPDGRRLAGTDWGRTYQSDVYVYDIETAILTKITHAGSGEAFQRPSWSPDGQKIAVVKKQSSQDICIMNQDGSGLVNLTPDWPLSNENYPSWTGDGQWILFSSDKEGNTDAFAMRIDGSMRVNLTASPSIAEGAPMIWTTIPTEGLVAYYPLKGNAIDASAHGHNGIVQGPTGTADRFGTADRALMFSGHPQHVIVNPFYGFPSTAITVSFWLKCSSLQGQAQAVVSYATTSHDNTFAVSISPPNVTITIYWNSINVPIAVDDSNWHHLVITWENVAGQVCLYKDGQLSATRQAAQGQSFSPTGSLVFGHDQDCVGGCFSPPDAFVGSLDDIRIYDRALSFEEVAGIYNAERPLAYNSRIFLASGVLAGQTINPARPQITISAGSRIQGSFTVEIRNTYEAGSKTPLAATPTWGEPSTSYSCVIENVAKGDTTHTVTVNLPAPTQAGTYYIVVAMAGTYNCAQIMSGTHPSQNADWVNGRKIALLPASLFQAAAIQGWTTSEWYLDGQMVPTAYAMTAVKVVVEDPGLYIDLFAGLKIEGVVGRTYTIKVNSDLNQPGNWTTLTNLTLTNAVQLWIDTTQPANRPKRFYMAVPQP